VPYIGGMKRLDIKRIRGELSQSAFADLLRISMRTLQDWEQGRHEPNSAAIVLLRLAESGVLKKPKR